MTTHIRTLIAVCGILAVSPLAVLADSGPDAGPDALSRELRNAWLPLESGMALSRSAGTPISAKYEIGDGAFQLSVYTMKGDTFAEVIVDYSVGTIARVDPLTDAGDLAAARSQQDAMAKATRTLESATADAVTKNQGYRAVSAMPGLSDGHPMVDVLLLNGNDWRTVSEPLD